MAVSDSIEQLLENSVVDAIESEYMKTQRDHGEYIGVVEAIQCLRRSYFNRKFPHTAPSWTTGALIGRYIHEVVEKYISEKMCEYIVDCERAFTDGILMGVIDILLRDPNDMSSIVVDLKTTSKIPNEPYYNHMLQVNTYLYLADADIGYIVYIDKRFTRSVYQTKFIKAFKVSFYNPIQDRWHFKDYILYEKVKKRAKILKRCLKYDELPPREWTENCSNCEHVTRCIE